MLEWNKQTDPGAVKSRKFEVLDAIGFISNYQ